MADDIQREHRGDITILSLPERLDASLDDTVCRVFNQLVSERRFKVVVDCERLRFLNSVILEVLVRFQQQTADHGGDLKFANVSDFIDDVFRVSNLDRLFLKYSTVDEAIDAF